MFPSVQLKKCEMVTTVIRRKRNILLLGKTGAGKSNVANHIVLNTCFRVSDSVLAVTSKTLMTYSVLRLPNIEYELRVIDTPGFFHGKLTNREVIQDIKTFLKRNVPEGVHLILFVLQYGRLLPDERTTFSYIMDGFKDQDVSNISALVITCCEDKSAWTREGIIREMTTHQMTKDIAKFMKKGVVCVGFPPLDEVDEELKEFYRRKAQKDTEQLHALIKESNDIRLQRQRSIM